MSNDVDSERDIINCILRLKEELRSRTGIEPLYCFLGRKNWNLLVRELQPNLYYCAVKSNNYFLYGLELLKVEKENFLAVG